MNQILNKENKEYAKKCFIEAINAGTNFKINAKVKKRKIDKSTIHDLFDIPRNGKTPDELIKEFENNIMPFCTNFSNTKFMGFPDAGNSISGITGAIFSDFLQQNLINSSFCAPIATYMEIAVIKWIREALGYKSSLVNSIWDVGGIITYGGTGSNATAMLLARENYHKNTMQEGVRNPEEYKVVIPKGIGHYSISSSLMWLGCGNNIIEVPTENYRYNLDELQKVLKSNKGKIMAVVVYAGDSRTMTIENLKGVYNICKSIDKNIWLHADACHGFSLAFSKEQKHKIDGINLYDSISTDPHKVLAIPYCISALVVKNPETLKLISSTSDLIMQEEFAFGQVTPFIGSKSWVSLKLWFAIQSLGMEGIGKIIDRRCNMAEFVAKKISQTKDFVVLNDVNINSVLFMYVGNKEKIKELNIKKLNKINELIYEKMLDDGEYYLHKFTIPDNKGIIKKDEILTPLRYMSGNDNIKENEIDDMINYIRKLAQGIDHE